MAQRDVYRYFCTTEGKFIKEKLPAGSAEPTVCVNDGGHTVDFGTLSVKKALTYASVGIPDTAIIKNSPDKTAAPTVNDDDTAGYEIGSYWIDTVSNKSYTCTDSSTGAAVWKDTTVEAITFTSLSATSKISTTSSSYVQVDGMTTTPAAGTYMVTFSCTGNGDKKNKDYKIGIFNNGSLITHTERILSSHHKDKVNLHTHATITVTGSEAIDVRYKTSKFTMYERSLILTKI